MPTPYNNPYVPGDPYSYDLKWIVEELKKAIALYTPLSDNFTELYNYVHDYFANLDLTSEVQSIIDQMITDGYFENLVYEYITTTPDLPNAVTEWLDANVDPVGSAVMIDETMSIKGAAADAYFSGFYRDNKYKQLENPVNLFDRNRIIPGGYFNGTGTWVVNATTNTSNYMPITPGETYFTNYSATKAICYFDENLNFISRVTGITTQRIDTDASLTTARYMNFSYSASSTLDIVCSKRILPTAWVSPNKADLAFFNLEDKKVVLFGDSVTATESRWVEQFKNRMNPLSVLNLAVTGAHCRDYSGTTFPYDGDPRPGAYQIDNVLGNQVQKYRNGIANTIYEKADIAIIFIGTNDNWTGEAGADIEDQFTSGGNYINVDTANRQLFAGSLRWAVENIYAENGYTEIIVITPIQCAEDVRVYTQQKDKADRIVEVAERMSLKVVDAFNNSGIYGRYEADGINGKYLQDGLHPNTRGGVHLGNYIADAISSKHLSYVNSNDVAW